MLLNEILIYYDHGRCSTKLLSFTLKQLQKKIQRDGTQRKHITQIERNLESLSALVLIFKKVFSFTFDKKQRRINLKSIYLYKNGHNENRWTSHNICLKIEYNLNEITTYIYCLVLI